MHFTRTVTDSVSLVQCNPPEEKLFHSHETHQTREKHFVVYLGTFIGATRILLCRRGAGGLLMRHA